MPVYEGFCKNASCEAVSNKIEFRVKSYDSENPACPTCGHTVHRSVSAPNVIWAKPLGWYQGGTGDGHVVYGKTEDGKKYTKHITTRQEQLAYCKANGLYDPMEIQRDSGLDSSNSTKSKATWI